ncbi:MAG: DnaB-like helicase C-terminal domain-containing protein [Desulforhopalus sp.]
MADGRDFVSRFYCHHLGVEWREKITADCPFCREHGYDGKGRLTVVLKPDSFFYGYFRCLNRCVPGGFPVWFARLGSLPLSMVPGYDPDEENVTLQPDYPIDNINTEVRAYRDRMTDAVLARFNGNGIGKQLLTQMQIGFNGRYLVFPYFQDDGNCYAARCVHPEKVDDYFWHGNEKFSREPFILFNREDINRCKNGALFVCEGEENLLVLKQIGFPGVAVSHYTLLERLPADIFDAINTVFICTIKNQESETAARNLASRIGFKARILSWQSQFAKGYDLRQLAKDNGRALGKKIGELVQGSRAFSPFASPQKELMLFEQTLQKQQGDEYRRLFSGFGRLDAALGGIHGINVIGGAPKVGKSTFTIQIGSEMALREIPVLYYDFENGRQKIYQRTLSRLARLTADQLQSGNLDGSEEQLRDATFAKMQRMFFFWRVINDRKITPELMRKHIDFIRHETRSEYTVVIVDSLHKLPFKEFSERRTGIDAWLRQMESIRDELHVSFLVISELSRDMSGSYRETPHLGVFKGSGDIEYSADNAMVLFPKIPAKNGQLSYTNSGNTLWLVASREHSPGRVADYRVDYPFWGFIEQPVQDEP